MQSFPTSIIHLSVIVNCEQYACHIIFKFRKCLFFIGNQHIQWKQSGFLKSDFGSYRNAVYYMVFRMAFTAESFEVWYLNVEELTIIDMVNIQVWCCLTIFAIWSYPQFFSTEGFPVVGMKIYFSIPPLVVIGPIWWIIHRMFYRGFDPNAFLLMSPFKSRRFESLANWVAAV